MDYGVVVMWVMNDWSGGGEGREGTSSRRDGVACNGYDSGANAIITNGGVGVLVTTARVAVVSDGGRMIHALR